MGDYHTIKECWFARVFRTETINSLEGCFKSQARSLDGLNFREPTGPETGYSWSWLRD